MILRYVKMRKKNLSMALSLIDYKKAYDMVPHSWILECLKALGIDEGNTKLLENSMKRWSVEWICGSESLEDVGIKRGIFQGESLSLTSFCCMFNVTDVFVKEMRSRL